jgi:hypothetical protein
MKSIAAHAGRHAGDGVAEPREPPAHSGGHPGAHPGAGGEARLPAEPVPDDADAPAAPGPAAAGEAGRWGWSVRSGRRTAGADHAIADDPADARRGAGAGGAAGLPGAGVLAASRQACRTSASPRCCMRAGCGACSSARWRKGIRPRAALGALCVGGPERAAAPHCRFTTVCNDHYFSSLLAVRECYRRGYRRPGLGAAARAPAPLSGSLAGGLSGGGRDDDGPANWSSRCLSTIGTRRRCRRWSAG